MTAKITISLPDDYVAAMQAMVAAGEAPSVSAIVRGLLGPHLAADPERDYREWMDEMHGPVPEEVQEWARRVLDGEREPDGSLPASLSTPEPSSPSSVPTRSSVA